MLKERIATRMDSDAGESLTISQLLWIVFTVVLVLFVGQLLYKAIAAKGESIADCIDQSNTLFDKVGSTCADSTSK